MCQCVIYRVFVLCLVFAEVALGADQTPAIGVKGTRCYDGYNRPQRCLPEFENAAFNVQMEATNTCGDNGQLEFCHQTGTAGIRKSCDVCYPNQHHARYLTDFHNQDNPTWWQSETMLEGIQWPNQVNLTLKFGKSFDITYVRLWFWSPRPESFYISRRITENGPWIPYQYYSATCRDTYGLPEMTNTRKGEESRALCTSEYSEISPLRGGNVAFATLEGRPSAYNFDGSPELQEWVAATEIMVTLDRINTFGDEVFGDDKVLRSYFYAIADVAVGARCKCNGHASECVLARSPDGRQKRMCRCEHNTAGSDCNECLPFYNDAPWGRANDQNAHECKQCNCNGFSNRCYFDEQLYEQTGHGGHCLDCDANRDGPTCETCRENYFMREDGYCVPCDCHPTGSRSLQCNAQGRCQCHRGVTGEKCSHCEANSFDFSPYGCKSCGCSELGSLDNEPRCDAYSGSCYCKENVEGKRCRECKPGFFNLNADNKFGCTPCFCFGHSSSCKSAVGYSKYLIESSFSRSDEKWSAIDQFGREPKLKYDSFTQSVGVKALGDEIIYFVAPRRFLGDQRASYNQLLEFNLRISDNRAVPTATDIVLEGSGVSISNTIFSQQNRVPSVKRQKFSFRLHEHPDYGWQPRLSSRAFMSLLNNLTAIKIKGIYNHRGEGFLDDVKLETASRGVAGVPALWIESCDCPAGYVGQFCESCAPGFRHSPSLGGSFMPCIPCDCNNHASICDSETGKCICQHKTVGENCELCARGYYGNALGGTPSDCQPCGCPKGGACIQVEEHVTMCTECPLGYTGHKCESCSDGFFGDPKGRFGSPTPCQPCDCNRNIDPNAIGNCNTTTGECLRCIHNTDGRKCEMCLPGFYGNALVLPKGDCRRCECFAVGTEEDPSGAPICDQTTGACRCKVHVVGQNCDKCEEGYFDLHSGKGCHTCNCDPIGSLNPSCDVYSGQCYCRPHVTGPRCDHCEYKKYGFSITGCKDCGCDEIGSKDLQCNSVGQCPCLDNVEGQKCNRCKENKYDRRQGCIDCPDCYNLVQNAARTHNDKLDRLGKILDEIESRPTVIADEEFPSELRKTEREINQFYFAVKSATARDSMLEQVRNIENRGHEISRTLAAVDENIFQADTKNTLAENNFQHADDILDETNEKILEIDQNYHNRAVEALKAALKQSEFAGQQSQKMTQIAQEARSLADDIDTEADHIIAVAKDTKNKSIIAYAAAKDALARQSEMGISITQLKNELQETEQKLSKSKEWTREVSDKTTVVRNNALTLLSEVQNIFIPQVNISDLRRKSKELKEDAFRLSNATADLFEDSEGLRRKIDGQNNLGKELLQRAKDQHEQVMDLRNDLVFCESQADGAINLWNDILEEAETNYKLLSEFDSQTQKNKEEAESALRKIGDIELTIKDILNKSKDAQVDMEEAKKNAELALEKAEKADEMAKNASLKADQIKSEAELLFKNTTELGEEAELMFDRVQNTEGELKNLLDKFKSNASLVNDAKEKVGRAGKDTDNVSKKVSALLLDIEGIMSELQNSPTIQESDIDRLEEEIRMAEEKIKEARLEEKLQTLQNEHKSQTDLIGQYKVEIAVLQDEVENIEEIIGALPVGCYRRIVLEP